MKMLFSVQCFCDPGQESCGIKTLCQDRPDRKAFSKLSQGLDVGKHNAQPNVLNIQDV
jgi:hypothetical protein